MIEPRVKNAKYFSKYNEVNEQTAVKLLSRVKWLYTIKSQATSILKQTIEFDLLFLHDSEVSRMLSQPKKTQL